jgi:hypothetical protein
MQIGRVHGRRLERDEQHVATGVKLRPGDELDDLCGVTETVQAKRVHLIDCRCFTVWFGSR